MAIGHGSGKPGPAATVVRLNREGGVKFLAIAVHCAACISFLKYCKLLQTEARDGSSLMEDTVLVLYYYRSTSSVLVGTDDLPLSDR